MPCFTIRRTTVDMAIANLDLLGAAFKTVPGVTSVVVSDGQVRAQHFDGLVYWRDGKLYLPASLDANVFKRAYAAETIKAVAKKNNWSVQAQGANKFLAMKGGW